MGGWGVASLAVVALSGCDYFWHLDHVDLDPDAVGAVDADLRPPPLCTSVVIDDTFMQTTVNPCGMWGQHYSNANANITQGGGHLRIEPTADDANAGCDATLLPLADGGVIVHVTQVIPGDDAYTSVQLNMTTNVTITINGDTLWFEDGDATNRWADTPYVASEMGWLRLRPLRRPDAIIAEYSKDSLEWHELGTLPMAVPTNVLPSIVAGVNKGAPTVTGMSDFAEFIVCRTQP